MMNQEIILNRSGRKEVMPMIDSSSTTMGLLVENGRLCAGAVL